MRLLRMSEVAARLGVTPQTVRRYCDAGRFPVVRLPGSWERRVPEASIDKVVADLRKAASACPEPMARP